MTSNAVANKYGAIPLYLRVLHGTDFADGPVHENLTGLLLLLDNPERKKKEC